MLPDTVRSVPFSKMNLAIRGPFVLGKSYPTTLIGSTGQLLSKGVARFNDENSGSYRADEEKPELIEPEKETRVFLFIGRSVLRAESWHRCLYPRATYHFHFILLDKVPVAKPEEAP